MGLMLGELVDDYTVRVIDVFAMPQSGTVSLYLSLSLSLSLTHTHTHKGVPILTLIISLPQLQYNCFIL